MAAAQAGDAVPLPTDLIVFVDDTGGCARVGFGGMSFEGMEEGRLVFYRVRDLQPEGQLSPQRGREMTLGGSRGGGGRLLGAVNGELTSGSTSISGQQLGIRISLERGSCILTACFVPCRRSWRRDDRHFV